MRNTPKKLREKTLIKQMMEAWSVYPRDKYSQLRSASGKLLVYPKDKQLHKAQLAHLRSL